jgi:DNA-binding NtrC family response regulator
MTDLKNINLRLVEDEEELCRRTARFLRRYCGTVQTAANGVAALESIAHMRPDVVVSDIRMPVLDGIDLATRLKAEYPGIPVIFCTAFTETAYLLKAIELGIAALVPKPINTDLLLNAIRKAILPIIQQRQLDLLNSDMVAMTASRLGKGKVMKQLAAQAAQVAATDYAVLLLGETGAGKSHLAALIHDLSPRRDNPFIIVNLGALPEQLAESELFGHARGAFTGADLATKGLVAAASGGTLFFDEIEAAPRSLQVKILRLVEQKQYLSIGHTAPCEANVRIIAASNRDLAQLAARGEFREDLYYRLADLVITLPPLREMPEEIEPLTQHFVRTTCAEINRSVPVLTPEFMKQLATHPWKGNIRELKSVIRRTLLTAGPVLEIADIIGVANRKGTSASGDSGKKEVATLRQTEEEAIRAALEAADGRQAAAARLLDIDYSRFKRLLEKHGIAR